MWIGNRVAPTPPAGDSSNRVADTAFVSAAIASALVNYPAIVASTGLTAQTASIPTTTLYTPASPGIFVASFYIITQIAGTGGTANITFSWTDTDWIQTLNTTTISLAAGGSSLLGSYPVYSRSGSGITYSTTVTGPTGSPQYAVWIRLQSLG